MHRVAGGRSLWPLAAPALALYSLFVLAPLLGAVAISLTQWDGITPARFAGLANYTRALTGDPIFLRSFWNNALYVAMTLVVEVGAGLAFAALLQLRVPGATFWRGLFFSPMVLSMVVVGLLGGLVLAPDGGLLNEALAATGLRSVTRAWLGEEETALIAIAAVSGWRFAGFYMALFAAGLARIPAEVLEAGRLDGAGEWTLFRRVTLPLLLPVVGVAVLLCVTGGFQSFDLFFVMTDGQPYHATEIPTTWMIKKAFNRQSLGYGSALAVILALFVVGVAITARRVSSREGSG